MSQGDVWIYRRTGERGLEIEHNSDYLQLAFMHEDWPFPARPVWVLRKDCHRARPRYQKRYPDDMEDSPL